MYCFLILSSVSPGMRYIQIQMICSQHEADNSCDSCTLPETNTFAPENGWLEYHRFLLEWPIFRGYLSFREGIMLVYQSVSICEFCLIYVSFWS